MYALAAATVGESRAEILNVLDFENAVNSSDLGDIYKPFQAYANFIKSMANQPDDEGYLLKIGKVHLHIIPANLPFF